jgi:transposase-like protein
MAKADRVERREHWGSLIEEQRRSGQTVSAFCREKGVSEPSFYSWRRKLSPSTGSQVKGRTDGEGRESPFISLSVVDPPAAMELLHPLGYRIRLHGEVNRTMLANVLDAIDRSKSR